MKQKNKEESKEQKLSRSEKRELNRLRDTVDALQKEKDQLFEKLQRVSADYANFQKRVPKQIADTISYDKEMIIKTLLPALDNFEHTLANSASVENVDVFVKGVQIIYDQMLDILKSHGVEQIKALAEMFDPALHQAMMQQSKPDRQDNTVLEEFQKGYKLNGRVIRPSKVVVNKLQPQEPPEQEQQSEGKLLQENTDAPEQDQAADKE